jgi:hypothetical protein
MTREAVEEGFELFLESAIDVTFEEFSVARAFRGSRGATGAVVDKLLKNSDALHQRVVTPEIEEYRRRTLDQFGVVLDYVESDGDIEHYREDILETGPVVESIRTDISSQRRESVHESLLEQQLGLGEAVEPLIETEKSAFWPAVTETLSREDATTLVSEHFAFTQPLRSNREAIAMTARVEPSEILGGIAGMLPTKAFEVEYTGEALRSMYRAEQAVIQEAEQEIAERFD